MVKDVKEKPVVEKSESFFPKLMLIFGLLVVAVGVVNFFSSLIPKLVTDIVLVLSGLWILKTGISMGVYKKRAGAIKKYI